MENTGLLATILAVWGIIFTINSAASAFLQTKWIWNQKKLLAEIRDLLKRMAGDDLQKMDYGCSPCPTCGKDYDYCTCVEENPK